jgi:hypothetical protein
VEVGTEIDDILLRNSPLYLMAFEAGYEWAKKEMIDKLKSMKALTETTGTVSFEEAK